MGMLDIHNTSSGFRYCQHTHCHSLTSTFGAVEQDARVNSLGADGRKSSVPFSISSSSTLESRRPTQSVYHKHFSPAANPRVETPFEYPTYTYSIADKMSCETNGADEVAIKLSRSCATDAESLPSTILLELTLPDQTGDRLQDTKFMRRPSVQ